jgi:hypothetical protein
LTMTASTMKATVAKIAAMMLKHPTPRDVRFDIASCLVQMRKTYERKAPKARTQAMYVDAQSAHEKIDGKVKCTDRLKNEGGRRGFGDVIG